MASIVIVWTPGEAPTYDGDPVTVANVATSLKRSYYTTVTGREGSTSRQTSPVAMRVRIPTGHRRGRPEGDLQWLLRAWPNGDAEPTKL